MARESAHRRFWPLVRWQHGVVARPQLRDLGYSDEAIEYRIERGRLRPVFRGVYAVGRPEVSRLGRWMAAVLACGPDAALSHESAAALMQIRRYQLQSAIEVSVPLSHSGRTPGLRVHRRKARLTIGRYHRIPVTSPIDTIVDLAARLGRDDVEAMANEADKLDLVDVETLRAALDTLEPRPGLAFLRATLDRRTFVYTDTALERAFVSIALRAGLPLPLTQRYANSYRVDFIWPDLGLIVEADGLRYHRTPAQQAQDRLRDQTHTAAVLTTLRFTHGQIRYEPEHVERILRAVAERLAARAA